MSRRSRTPSAAAAARIAVPALAVALALAGCAQSATGDGASPSPSLTAPTTSESPTTPASSTTPAPSTTPPATPSAPEPPASADWPTFAVGDGHTSWRLPQGWSADIEREVVEGRAEWTDYRGFVRDGEGTLMLRFEAVASGGQYGTDFWPCERPETEVFEVTPMGDQVVDPGAALVSLAHEDGRGGVTLAVGISELDAETACEPDIHTLYQDDAPSGYDFLLFQIVDDAGESYPRFDSFAAARDYLESDEYRAIHEVLASFRSQ